MASGIQNALIDLVALVETSVSSEGNVGSDVFIHGGDQSGMQLPYILIDLEGDNSDGIETHDDEIHAERLDFSVHIHTKTKTQGIQLMDLVIDGLHKFSGVQGNTTFGYILRDGAIAHFTTETKTNEAIVDFTSLITN